MIDLHQLPAWPQSQDSLAIQIANLVLVANRLGLYDAADAVKQMATELDQVKYGCHIDLYDVEQPDDCVIDSGRHNDLCQKRHEKRTMQILAHSNKPTNRGTTMSKPKEQLMPPDDLIAEWQKEWWLQGDEPLYLYIPFFVAKAAQWGADQELEACCDWLDDNCCVDPHDNAIESIELRAARRPKPLSLKPLSLKQQALETLDQADNGLSESEWQQRSDIIRRALEALPDE